MPSTFATGLAMGESPRWHDHALWACDWLAGEVLRFDAAGGRAVVHRVQGFPFSIDWLADGRLVATSPEGVLVESGGALTPYGASGRGWNEIVAHPAGHVFVNEAGFDLMGGQDPKPGTIAVVMPDGSSREVATNVWFPNGMAISADGSTLLCAESYAHRISAFDVAGDGSLTGRRVWAQLDDDCYPDGICLDEDGMVWYADVPNRRCVRVAAGGTVRDLVEIDRGAFACMLGGDAGRTLFVIANRWDGVHGGASSGVVLKTEVETAHAGRP